jgi:hypothetical protein
MAYLLDSNILRHYAANHSLLMANLKKMPHFGDAQYCRLQRTVARQSMARLD